MNIPMPSLIYGTAWKKEATADLVVGAVLAGFRGIDTACQPKHYDESLVGVAISRLASHGISREDLFVQTKFTPLDGQDPQRVPYNPEVSLSNQVMQSFRVSQKNLQTHYVDSLVLHSPLRKFEDLMSIWQAMETIYDEGGAYALGISNCYSLELLQKLYAEARVKPSIVQNRFYAQSGFDSALRAWCLENQITYQSFWSLTANPHILNSESVLFLGKKYAKTSAQIMYRYLNHLGVVPLIGSTSQVHLREDLDIFSFELTPEEIKSIVLQ